MRTFIRKFHSLVVILFWLALAPALRAAAPAPDDHHDLLAHGSRQAFWFAVVIPNPLDTTQLQTRVFVRDPHTTQQWVELAPLAGRAVALADDGSRDTEASTVVPDDTDASGLMADAIALMDDGQWVLVSDGHENRSGNNIPGRGRILALCNDADTIWAIGQTYSPTTLPPSTTKAATNPDAAIGQNVTADFPVAAPTTLLSAPRTALFNLQRGQWIEVGPAPADAALTSTANLSMAMLGSYPTVASEQPDHSIVISQFAADLNWHPAGIIAPDPDTKYLKLLGGADSLTLWTAPDKGPGTLYINGPNWSPAIPLKVLGPSASLAAPATARNVAIALDRVRLLWFSDDKIYQQNYDKSGVPLDSATTIQPAEATPAVEIPPWFLIALVGMVTVVTLVALRNRPIAIVQTAGGAGLALAPFGLRVLSGLIDGLPVLVAALRSSSELAIHDQAHARDFLLSVLVGLAVYVVHTFLGEFFFAASIGKFLTGLCVVDKSGNSPSAKQIIIRGLARIVEWPIMVFVALRTPLHQRIGDLLAGTVVVLSTPPPDEEEPTAGQ